MKNKILILLFSIFLFSICFSIAVTQTNYFPGTTWQVKTPAEMKLNKTLLDSAVNFALRSENKVERDLRIGNRQRTNK